MAEPSISIAMCTYNGERYVQEQLDSFLRQTRLPDELIVCDDASTDRTADIITAFARSAPFAVRLFVQPANVGIIANVESAISRCSKDIIFLSDQDDVWLEDKIRLMVQALCSASDASGVFCNSEIVDDRLVKMGFSHWDYLDFSAEVQDRFRRGQAAALLLRRNYVQGACFAFRATCRPATLFPVASGWPHDHWMAILLSMYSRLVFVDEKLVLYRQHGGNLIGVPRLPPSAEAPKWLRKLRAPRQYYLKKLRDFIAEERKFDQLATGLAGCKESERYSGHRAWIEERLHFLKRRRRKIQRVLLLLGCDWRRATRAEFDQVESVTLSARPRESGDPIGSTAKPNVPLDSRLRGNERDSVNSMGFRSASRSTWR